MRETTIKDLIGETVVIIDKSIVLHGMLVWEYNEDPSRTFYFVENSNHKFAEHHVKDIHEYRFVTIIVLSE